MADPALRDKLRAIFSGVDPRRSFGAAATWLIVSLAVTFSIAAAIWVGSIARHSVLEQHIRRLALETDQLGSDLGQAIAARLGAVRVAGAMAQAAGKRPDNLGAVFEELTAAYPSLDWIAAADAQGMIVASRQAQDIGTQVATGPWLSSGIRAPGWVSSTNLARPTPRLRKPLPTSATSPYLSGTRRIRMRESSSRTYGGEGPRIIRSG